MNPSHRFIIGDVREVLASLPAQSVDLVASSPPFLALRSYLPSDHPDKALEIGSEATPADFLDTLLDVVEECRRVLAPHGSLVFELGDTYSGSGGGGGDYLPGGMREGQPGFGGSAEHQRAGNAAHWRAKNAQRDAWPLDKSLCGIPTLFAWSLAYGRNLLRPERTTEPWRIRNVVAWCRPNPPVGALGDKFRPATSYITVATMARDRWFDMDAVRVPSSHDTNGAPLLDYWEIPTQPYKGSHYATFPEELPRRAILSMCANYVCLDCGTALGSPYESTSTEPVKHAAGNPLSGMRPADHEQMGHGQDPLLLEGMCQQEHGQESPDDQGAHPHREGLHHGASTGAPDGGARGLRDGTSPRDGSETRSVADIRGCSAPRQRSEGRQPSGEPDPSPEGDARQLSEDAASSRVSMVRARRSPDRQGTLACGRCGSERLRPGIVLDPFAGSGTTLRMALGNGRSAIGIDLDERNADLALDRVGPLYLTVERLSAEASA